MESRFRRRAFPDATASDWNDWRWQLCRRIRTAEVLQRILTLSVRENKALHAPEKWRMPLAITPYALCLLDAESPDGPLRRTLLPDAREERMRPGEFQDPLGEEPHQIAPGLIQSYPHKALLLLTSDCAAFCRFCTRSRRAGKTRFLTGTELQKGLSVLRSTPAIRDVLLSGGDPLLLPDARLERLLKALRGIPHLRLIRIGTRTPAMLPQRITPALVRMLKKYQPLWMSLHFAHPAELTPRSAAACRRLREAGLPLMNQTVLLRGVNDNLQTLTELNEGLLTMGVKPWYLHQGDAAAGTSHLRSSIRRGRKILREMQGTVSGYAIPQFMLDPPGGGGKHPL